MQYKDKLGKILESLVIFISPDINRFNRQFYVKYIIIVADFVERKTFFIPICLKAIYNIYKAIVRVE